MSTTTTEPKNATRDLFEPVPERIQKEEQEALALSKANLAHLALKDPKAVAQAIAGREQSLELLTAGCLKRTHPFDWTLYQDRDQRVVGVLRDSGAVNVRKLMGISIFNYRPLVNGYPSPQVTNEPVGDGNTVKVVELWADAICALTGEPVEGVYYALRSDDDFIGRERKSKTEGGEDFVSEQDMKASCRTGLDAKIVRILSGLRKVPADVLTAHGIKLDQCHRGRGYGTGADRNAGKVADPNAKAGIEQLKAEVLRRVGGDVSAVKKLSLDITSDGKGFKGFDSLDRITQTWQLEKAWERLKAHPVFGDRAAGKDAPAAAAAPPAKGAPPVQGRIPGEDD